MNVKTLCVCISLYRILNFFYFSNIFDNLIIFFIIFSKKKIVLDFARKSKYSQNDCKSATEKNTQICKETKYRCKFATKILLANLRGKEYRCKFATKILLANLR